jgi:hypothetical protein
MPVVKNQYYSHPTQVLENDSLRLEYLIDAGPRIVSLGLKGCKENLLAELPEHSIPTPFGEFRLFGGHRLWYGPEAFPGSYIPDDNPVQVETLPSGVRLTAPPESPSGMRKAMEIRLEGAGPVVEIWHILTNESDQVIEAAPWAITMLQLGGLAILPLSTQNVDSHGLLPNRNIVLWPYASWTDKRLTVQNDYVMVSALRSFASDAAPFKIGALNRSGKVAYFHEGVLFVKRFNPGLNGRHVDFECNVETYCNHQFIELETLGPLEQLQPGESVQHVETWELHSLPDIPATIEGVRALSEFLK